MIIVYHREFLKDFKKLRLKEANKFKERLVLLEKDEFNPILNNHPLKGEFEGLRTINVTGDLRAIYKREKNLAIFIAVDSHSNLYG